MHPHYLMLALASLVTIGSSVSVDQPSLVTRQVRLQQFIDLVEFYQRRYPLAPSCLACPQTAHVIAQAPTIRTAGTTFAVIGASAPKSSLQAFLCRPLSPIMTVSTACFPGTSSRNITITTKRARVAGGIQQNPAF